ncbi:MAG: SDR family NAD(P)-dependent oxidoreductase [Pseudomonadota bacterium]
MNTIDLSGRTAIITGGGSGIGLATARQMLLSGARIELWGRDADRLVAAAKELGAPERVSTQSVNVGDPAAVQAAAADSLRRLGAVDILVNNAGVTPGMLPMAEVTLEDWRENMAVNLDGVFFTCRAFVPGMVSRGWGRVINLSSMAGKEGNPFQSAYSAAKAGVIGFTKSLAKEVGTSGVTVNAVAPTLFETPLLAWARRENPQAMQIALEKIPMRRIGKPEEAAALITWIASDQCAFTTGFTFDLSGGRATY